MGQKKLIRFNAIKAFDNVHEYPQDKKGEWARYFGNDHPLTLELACGKGEYAVGLARLHPDGNYIGLDVKGNRIWRGAKTALDEHLHNVAFVRTQIDKIADYFAKDEVDHIWITFPDPQLRLSRMKKRLTHPKFLRMYQSFLKAGGTVNLKTDSPDLYQFTKTVIALYNLELLQDVDHVHALPEVPAELQIKTHYEGLDIAGSQRIHYLQFRINRVLPEDLDNELKETITAHAVEGRR
jgi:tRNA (guanine-N7-)-methyltransferase